MCNKNNKLLVQFIVFNKKKNLKSGGSTTLESLSNN